MTRHPFLILLACVFLPAVGIADPIKDQSMLPYKAGWYANMHKKRLMTCPATCKLHAKAAAEFEASGSPRTTRTFVCKVQKAVRLPKLTHKKPEKALYGNQFDNKVACYSANAQGKVSRSQRFHCLCVTPTGGGCPDLVVTQIFRPVWDSVNKRSVIKATIKNIGAASAGASIARVIDPSTNQPAPSGAPYNAIANTPALASGASVTVVFYLPYWVFNPDATLEVTADYKGMVKECNEKNNMRKYNAAG